MDRTAIVNQGVWRLVVPGAAGERSTLTRARARLLINS
jgi:hypothetical protein